jgi:DNA-binding beta-propeller fold protein YncE
VSPSERFLYVTSGGGPSKVSVFAIDVDGSLSPILCNPPSNCNTGADPYGVAVSPSGHYLYTSNYTASTVSVFAVNSDGSLLPLPCNPTSNCSTGTNPTGMSITPSGRFLYLTNRGSNSVSVFAIGSDGSLAPIACNPTSNCATGANPYSVAVSPSGSFLYVSNYSSNTVSVFAIGSDGSLTPVACNPTSNCSTGTTPTGVAVSPSGRFLYVTNHASTVSVFAINPDGSLAPIGCDPTSNCNTGTDPDFQSIAAQPDQGPRAVFGVRAGRRGVPTGFDGSPSSDSDGRVVRYDWDFGDGTKALDGGVTPTHRYARNGRYTVKLTVTDSSGCSTVLVFTGQTASCNGTSAATRSQPVGVDITLPRISGMKVTPGVIASARVAQVAKRRKLPRSGRIKYKLSEKAIVQLRLERRTLGRRVGKRCRRATRSNRKRRVCVRYVRIGRGLTQKGKKGRNSLRFSARTLEVHRLRASRYRVVAVATDAFGNRSRAKHTTFRVAKR